METWQAILIGFGGNAVLLLVLGWLARSLGSRALSRASEELKAELTAAVSAATEHLKDELQRVGPEHQAVFSERRAEVIAQLYGLLVETHRASQSLAGWSGDPSQQEKYGAAMHEATRLYGFFDKNRIYLSAALCQRLEQFFQDIRSKVISVYVPHDAGDGPAHPAGEKMDVWVKAHEYFERDMPGLRAVLETELRGMPVATSGVGVSARAPGEFPGPAAYHADTSDFTEEIRPLHSSLLSFFLGFAIGFAGICLTYATQYGFKRGLIIASVVSGVILGGLFFAFRYVSLNSKRRRISRQAAARLRSSL